MKNLQLLLGGLLLLIGCSGKKSSQNTEESLTKHQALQETAGKKYPIVNSNQQKDQTELEEFDISKIEYDTLDLPQLAANSNVSILTINQFHDREVNANAPNRDWVGLFKTDSSHYLERTQPIFERVYDVIVDSDNEKTGWNVSVNSPNKCIVLVSGLTLKEGIIPTVNIVNNQPLPFDTVRLETGEIKSSLIVSGTYHKGFIANYKMKILSSIQENSYERTIVAKRNFDDTIIKIIWAGDLDNDKKIDLIIDTSRHYNAAIPTLFLSSSAADSLIVECVAMHATVGC